MSGDTDPKRGGRRWRIAAAVLACVVAAIATFAIAFDWNWLRGRLERHLAERSGREVRIGGLDVDFESFLEPTVRLTGVHVQNADWASSKAPLIEAREVSARFALSSLWGDNYEVRKLTLTGAKVDMERLADGRRNWRVWNPENTGPGRVRVMLFEGHDSQLRFVNRAIDLELTAAASPLGATDADARTFGLTTRIAYAGEYEGRAFSGEAAVPPAFSFRGSGITFPARGRFVSGGTRVEFDGLFADLFDIGAADARLTVTGPSLALVYPFVRVQPAPSRPYSATAQVTIAGNAYRFAGIDAKIGDTRLTGHAVYDRGGERPSLDASFSLGDAKVADVGPLVGMRQGGEGANSRRPFNLRGLRALDARVDVRASRLSVGAVPPLENVRGEARLQAGALELKNVEFTVAGGRVAGGATFDGRSDSPSASLQAEMRGANVDKLVRAAAERRIAGYVDAKLTLSSRGASAAEMIANLAGALDARLHRGTISDLSDAKLAMAFGRVIGSKLRGERDIAIGCALAAFNVRGGVARSRQITLDTERTRVDGRATVDLRNESFDAVLTPHEKNPGLLTKRASLRVSGEIDKPQIAITERVEQPQGACGS